MIIEKQVIESLKREAETNKVANAVFYVFALRDRTRSTLTIHALDQRMKLNKFIFPREEYCKIVKLLSELDLGTLVTNGKGKIIGLKDIRVTLQSVGNVACNKVGNLEGFHARNKYEVLELPKKTAKPAVIAPPAHEVMIAVRINGAKFEIPVAKSLSENEIASLIKSLL
jgi:hypothetical protein